MKEQKKERYIHGIVPKDSTYQNSKIYNELKSIKGTYRYVKHLTKIYK